jgi:hypothetical protein
VLQTTMTLGVMMWGDARSEALRDTVGELMQLDEPRKAMAGMLAGAEHPLRPRRGAPAARTADARSRPRHR